MERRRSRSPHLLPLLLELIFRLLRPFLRPGQLFLQFPLSLGILPLGPLRQAPESIGHDPLRPRVG